MALKPLPLKGLKRNEKETNEVSFDKRETIENREHFFSNTKKDADEKEAHYSKENKTQELESWNGMEECEDILERDNSSKDTITLEKDNVSNERVFEELHKTNGNKETLGDKNLSKGKIQAPEKTKSPKMEEYVKQREDGLITMAAGNSIHYQIEHQENVSGQNYLNQSSQVVTEDYHNEREFALTDDVVEDAFDMEDTKCFTSETNKDTKCFVNEVSKDNMNESIDDIVFEGERETGVVYIYPDEESDLMAFPSLDDEDIFSGEIEHKSPWSN